MKRQKIILSFLGVFAICLMMGVIWFLLYEMGISSDLQREIREKENILDELQSANDYRQYALNASYSIDEIIEQAKEMGMIHATADQIVYYEAEEDEYLYINRDLLRQIQE